MAGLVGRELLPYKGDFYLWKYVPSIAAAVVFLLIFLLLSLWHTWIMARRRMWFCLAFVIGGYRKTSSPVYVGAKNLLTAATAKQSR